jgi:hypothetical protein
MNQQPLSDAPGSSSGIRVHPCFIRGQNAGSWRAASMALRPHIASLNRSRRREEAPTSFRGYGASSRRLLQFMQPRQPFGHNGRLYYRPWISRHFIWLWSRMSSFPSASARGPQISRPSSSLTLPNDLNPAGEGSTICSSPDSPSMT